MQIKKVNKKTGEITHFTPRELLDAAILYSMRIKSSLEEVYWVMPGTLVAKSFSSIDVPDPEKPKEKPGFQASATGTVKLGKTVAKTDRFYEPKEYSFSIKYRSTKDYLGLPDIEVTEADFKLVDRHAKMRFEDVTLSFPDPVPPPASTASPKTVSAKVVAKVVTSKKAPIPAPEATPETSK